MFDNKVYPMEEDTQPTHTQHPYSFEEDKKLFRIEVLDKFANRTSLCGMHYMKDSPKALTRVIWTAIFLAMFAASGVQLQGIVQTYLK